MRHTSLIVLLLGVAQIGQRTVETVVRYLRGEDVPPFIAVPASLVTRDSLTGS